MKRSPMKRGKPLRRTSFRSKAGRGLVRQPLTIKGKRSASWHRSRQWAFDRAGGRCEPAIADAGCTGRAEHAHHIRMRSQGGSDDPSNLLACCHRCHAYIHANPAQSYLAGWLRHREAS